MRTAEQARARTVTWLDRNLTERVAAGNPAGFTIGLDAPSGTALRNQWPSARDWALAWRQLEPTLPPDAHLGWVPRLLGGGRQDLPAKLALATIDAAAAWAGASYPARLALARHRWAALTAAFPTTATEPILRTALEWADVDWELLLSTAAWFAAHPIADHTWTPRQVPVPGLHAKWLDAAGRRTLIARLLGVDQIELQHRPTQVRVTYLDPAHAAAGRRRWDIITAGDVVDWPYPPTVALIVENRDTAFYFPPTVPGGILLLGNGDAALTVIAAVAPMLADIHLRYWGDLDADGLRIVSRIRSRGHPVDTILMDCGTYDTYSRFGTNRDPSGKTITPGDPVPPPLLTGPETELYLRLTDPAFTGHRRVEQERIPLQVAVDQLR